MPTGVYRRTKKYELPERIKKTCPICGKNFQVIPSLLRIKSCSVKCSRILGRDFIPWNKGKPWSDEMKQRISETNKRKGIEPKIKYKGKGKDGSHWKGGKDICHICGKLLASRRTKNKLCIKCYGKSISKEKHYNWNGGTSFEPYTVDWTDTLKRSIRQRDKYTCQLCDKEPSVCVHHIDYNKKNCSSENLVTLCKGCHPKTNTNRDYWTEYFQNLMSGRNNG